jgi:Flp pilus assembly protein TadG
MLGWRSQTLTIGHPDRIHEKTIAQQQPKSCTSHVVFQRAASRKGGTMRRNHELGQALVAVALGLVVLLGMLGLGIDFGYLRYEKGKMQAAADAAAIAGAAEVLYTDVSTAAQAAATADGFANGTSGVTVTVNHPPLSGPNTGNSNYVEAIVAQNQPTFFMKVLGVNSVPLSARSVALGSSPNCIYGLGTSGDSIDNLLAFVTVHCGVISNANLGVVGVLTATSIGVHGVVNGFVFTNPPARTGIPQVSDPFASLTTPTAASCAASGHPTKTVITTNTTLSQGTYCGGINILGGNVTFNPGIYILNGGGFQMTNLFGGTVSGTGVTFYNTGIGAGSCNTCYGPMTTFLTTGSSLSAPTTGTYAGLLFFQDRSNPQTASFNANFGTSTTFMEGAYYFPDATVQFNFDFGASAAYTILVAKEVQWFVSFTVNNDFSSLPEGSPIKNTGVLTE